MYKPFSFQHVGTYGPGYQPLPHPERPLRRSLHAISVDLDAAADQAISACAGNALKR